MSGFLQINWYKRLMPEHFFENIGYSKYLYTSVIGPFKYCRNWNARLWFWLIDNTIFMLLIIGLVHYRLLEIELMGCCVKLFWNFDGVCFQNISFRCSLLVVLIHYSLYVLYENLGVPSAYFGVWNINHTTHLSRKSQIRNCLKICLSAACDSLDILKNIYPPFPNNEPIFLQILRTKLTLDSLLVDSFLCCFFSLTYFFSKSVFFKLLQLYQLHCLFIPVLFINM